MASPYRPYVSPEGYQAPWELKSSDAIDQYSTSGLLADLSLGSEQAVVVDDPIVSLQYLVKILYERYFFTLTTTPFESAITLLQCQFVGRAGLGADADAIQPEESYDVSFYI